MKIHREGSLIVTLAISTILCLVGYNFYLLTVYNNYSAFIIAVVVLIIIGILIVQFFRIPSRTFAGKENEIISPADGTIVVIEEIEQEEYFNDRRIQVSIFMSPFNVHANFNPISGIVKYVKYHKGKYLYANNPKSSTDNERATFVVEHKNGKEIMFRQIAGLLARRICYYIQPNQKVKGGNEFGFIKFGSRIDLFLPIGTKIDVKLGDKVKGKITRIAQFE